MSSSVALAASDCNSEEMQQKSAAPERTGLSHDSDETGKTESHASAGGRVYVLPTRHADGSPDQEMSTTEFIPRSLTIAVAGNRLEEDLQNSATAASGGRGRAGLRTMRMSPSKGSTFNRFLMSPSRGSTLNPFPKALMKSEDRAHSETEASSDMDIEQLQEKLFKLSASIIPQILKQERTPMLVVPYEAWLKAGHFPRSSEKLTRPVVKSLPEQEDDDWVIFISHRWWDPQNGLPDNAAGEKYDTLCRGICEIIEGEGWDESNIVIWCDFACIDQDDHELQKCGIESLVSYAARSDAVITPVQDEEKAIESFTIAEHPADLVNYGERAWCRLETYIFMCLSEMLMKPLRYYGFGKATRPKGTMSCFGCMGRKAQTNWCLKLLAAESTDIDFVSRQADEQKDSVNDDQATLKDVGAKNTTILTKQNSFTRRLSRSSSKIGVAEAGGGGASFAESQLPSSGDLTVETDRAVIEDIERRIRKGYVHFSILSQCTQVRLATGVLQDAHVSFTLVGKQIRSQDLRVRWIR
mmetsp:Transcript_26997/g.72591  ORF Transcript_26997/g.72591 Transcript_26997/m.72591 type:complete len:526 (-) Transcript_26997:546-2123(-)